MIYIEERANLSMPALKTSLFIKIPFSIEIYNFLLQLRCKTYHKSLNEWEVPVTSSQFIIDRLTFYDDIELKLLPDINVSEIKQNNLLDFNKFKTMPYEYQKEGIEYGINHTKWLLLDFCGLGKSLQSIYTAEELYNEGKIKNCLVICGINSLKSNWVKEIKKHSKLSCKILGSRYMKNGTLKINVSLKDRLDDIKNKGEQFFTITNVETLRDKQILSELKEEKNTFDMIIFDEIHCVKSPTSQQGAAIKQLVSSKYSIGMTGTVIMNNPLDCYIPLYWIGEEKSNYTNFCGFYLEYDPLSNIPIGFIHLDILKEQLARVSLRRDDTILNLPKCQIIPTYLEMNPDQSKFYKDIKAGIINEVDKVHMSRGNILGLITRLRQATALPSILSSSDISAVKIDYCCEKVKELLSSNHKVVIFSTFKDPAKELARRLQEYNPILATGDTAEDVVTLSQKFQSDPDQKIFIGTWQKCGTGIDLFAANNLFFIDIPWTNALFEQAWKRLHRIGATQPIFVYVLMASDTIDEKVFDTIQAKKDMASFMLNDSDIPDYIVSDLGEYLTHLK